VRYLRNTNRRQTEQTKNDILSTPKQQRNTKKQYEEHSCYLPLCSTCFVSHGGRIIFNFTTALALCCDCCLKLALCCAFPLMLGAVLLGTDVRVRLLPLP
jgi:hypothetical protein